VIIVVIFSLFLFTSIHTGIDSFLFPTSVSLHVCVCVCVVVCVCVCGVCVVCVHGVCVCMANKIEFMKHQHDSVSGIFEVLCRKVI
jgi:hypothetical protein